MIEKDLVDQLFNSSEKRLARLPLLLAHFETEGNRSFAKIRQETLAEMIGATRAQESTFHEQVPQNGLF